MQIQSINNQSFTGVIPVKFRIDEQFIHGSEFVQSAGNEVCRQLKSAVKNPEKAGKLAKELEKIDNDYNIRELHNRLNAGWIGLPGAVRFLTHDNKAYILTGKDAQKLEAMGQKIALGKHQLKACGYSKAAQYNLSMIMKEYGRTVWEILNDHCARVTSGLNEHRQRIGARVGLLCDMDVVKKGNDLKLTLQDFIFSSMIG